MKIEVNGKEYELYFGLEFLQLITEEFGLSPQVKGIDIPLQVKGANLAVVKLEQKDFVAVHKILRFALNTYKSQPSNKELEEFLNNLLTESTKEDDKYGDFVEELNENIKKIPAVAYELRTQA